jgi:hypothetical protein
MSKRPKTPEDSDDRPDLAQRATGLERLAERHLRFGWWALVLFASLGIGLESLHGFKVGWYVDASHESETRQAMWRLAHAHGTLLGLIHLAFAGSIPRLDARDARWRHIASPCLYSATLTLPAGFFLGGLFVYSGDPGMGILLVPVGGFLLVIAAWLIARGVRRGENP